MHLHKTGEDILNVFLEIINKYTISLKNCSQIATDGAPSMMGKYNGFVTLLNMKYPEFKFLGFYCIIHIEALCAKIGCDALDDLVLQVTKLIYFVKKRYLLHREFVKFLEEIDSEYTNVLYYTEVRWLSKGSVASRMYYLLPKFADFFKIIL